MEVPKRPREKDLGFDELLFMDSKAEHVHFRSFFALFTFFPNPEWNLTVYFLWDFS